MHQPKGSLTFLLIGGIILLSGLCFAGEQKSLSIRPSFARNASATVSSGDDVNISLNAIPSFGNQMIFQIQNPPLHGTLSGLRTTSDHTAAVTYRHDGSKAPLTDEFTFRAQGTGQSMSESAYCTISIIPRPALINYDPPSLDFGALMISTKKQQNVTIVNRGGVTAEGRLILPQGFTAPLGDRYRLGEGESNTIVIEFDPMEERAYDGQATTQPSCEKSALQLHGFGISRFELKNVTPTEWEVRNLCEVPIRISCTGGEGWSLPSETSLPPHESRRLIFQQSDENGGTKNSIASNAVVHLSDGLSDREISLPPLMRFTPIVLHAVTPSDLGRIPIGGTTQVSFSLINRSEYPKHVTWQITSQSGGGADEPEVVDLNGGESREIRYDWKPSLPGDAVIRLTVSEGKSVKSVKSIRSTEQALVWKATVLPSTGTSTSRSSHGNQGVMEGQELPVEQCQDPTLTGAKVTPIPPVSGGSSVVLTSWLGTPTLLLQWDATEVDPSCFKVEENQLELMEPITIHNQALGVQPPKTKEVIIPYDVSLTKKQGNRQVLKLPGLSPGWHHLVLSQFHKDGGLAARSQFQIRVPEKSSWWSLLRMPLGIVLISSLFLLFRDLRKGNQG